MTKAEFIAIVAEKGNLTKKDAETAVNAFTDAVQEALSKGEKVQLVGFGTFEVKERAERDGINPQTKEKMRIPATKAPSFKAGKNLKDVIANS